MEAELISGKVALVTGATRGLGRAIAKRLAVGGADVILHDEDEMQASRFGEAENPGEVVREMEATGRRCALVFGDLMDGAEAERVAREALLAFGRVDVLVNCAGGDMGAADEKPVPNDCLGIPEEDLRVMLDRNLTSVMHVTRALGPHFKERGAGSIINIASLAGMIPVAEGSVYAVAKAGLIHWTKCLAQELRPYGINVNAVSPGGTKSARFLQTRHVPPERLADRGRLTRLGEPDDVACVCLFLASDLARFVSGQNIEVSGGGH